MTNVSDRNVLALCCALGFGLWGCSDDGVAAVDATDTEAADDGATGQSSAGGTSGNGVSTGSNPSTTGPESTSGDSGDPGDSSMDDGTFINPGTSGEDGSGPQPLGGMCENADGCESGFCYVLPQLGGVCSECLIDEDCGTGTCSLDPIGYAVCTDGELGKMCNTDEGCMGDLVCAELIDTGGLVNSNFCSECQTTVDCEGEQICSPVYDQEAFAGSLQCVEPGSVPNDQGCPLEGGVGDATVCENGHCGVVDVFAGIVIGVCGDCSTDEDCPEGSACMPAQGGNGGLTGATCI
jgi:hypothetical protein